MVALRRSLSELPASGSPAASPCPTTAHYQCPTDPPDVQEAQSTSHCHNIQPGSFFAAVKMAPAHHAASDTTKDTAEPDPSQQLVFEHIMPPFSPPSDHSPCLPRSLADSTDTEDNLHSPEHTVSPLIHIPPSALCFSPETDAITPEHSEYPL